MRLSVVVLTGALIATDEITATLSDGRVLRATRIGIDSQLDLAVLKVAAGNLPSH